MGKSLDWCKKRIERKDNANIDVLNDATWSEIKLKDSIIANEEGFKNLINGSKMRTYIACENSDDKIEIGKLIYNPDAEFDYFSMERCRSDGTLLFAIEQQTELISKIILLKTVFAPKAPDITSVEQLKDYRFKYTIGDFVFIDEYSKDFGTEEKPWLMSRFTTLLPIRFDVEKVA